MSNQNQSASQQFNTVRQAYQESSQKKKIGSIYRESHFEQKSPRFQENNKQNNYNYLNSNTVRERGRKKFKQEQQILFSLSTQSLVKLVLETRRQLNQYMESNDQKQEKLRKLKTAYKQAIKEIEKMNVQNEKLLDYIQVLQHQKEEIKNLSSRVSKSTKHTTNFRQQTSSGYYENQVSIAQLATDKQFIEEVLKITNSENYIQSISKIKTLKQSSKFVCSLYKLIDQYTQSKYFDNKYSLTHAWTFIKKLFKEYFDENWIKSNSVVIQIQQILNCKRQELNDRILNMMRDLSKVHKILEKFKMECGLFWINDLNYLEKYLDNKIKQNEEEII